MSRTKKKKLCFVIGPLGKANSDQRAHADFLLKEIVKPVFRNRFSEFSVQRSDKIAAPGMIDSQIITALIEADLVIADMSMQNANAFYEMGVRHMVQKPIIHMYKAGEAIPFDVMPYRAIEFSIATQMEMKESRSRLSAAIQETFSQEFEIDTPVTRSRGMVRLKQKQSAIREEILGAVSSLGNFPAWLDGYVGELVKQQTTAGQSDRWAETIFEEVKRARETYERAMTLVKQKI